MENRDHAASSSDSTSDLKWDNFVGDLGGSYNYTRLPLGKFTRFVELLPASEVASPIMCVTKVQSISCAAHQPYEALSYVWGDARDRMQITLNGQEFYVRKNLYAALQTLRSHTQPRNLWIDAICIDQSSPLERNHQVSMMREIFSNAAHVIAWWGPEVASTKKIIECFTKDTKLDQSIGQAEMAAILSLNYWNRVWIVQEIVVAQDIIIQWGPYCMTWSDFTSFLRGFRDGVKYLAPIKKILRLRDGDRRQRNLLNLLHATETTTSTEPRDKIFALLGLIENDPAVHISADYTMSPCEVYCMTIRAIYMDCPSDAKNDAIFWRPHRDPMAAGHQNCEGMKFDAIGFCDSRENCLKILPWVLTKNELWVDGWWNQRRKRTRWRVPKRERGRRVPLRERERSNR